MWGQPPSAVQRPSNIGPLDVAVDVYKKSYKLETLDFGWRSPFQRCDKRLVKKWL